MTSEFPRKLVDQHSYFLQCVNFLTNAPSLEPIKANGRMLVAWKDGLGETDREFSQGLMEIYTEKIFCRYIGCRVKTSVILCT